MINAYIFLSLRPGKTEEIIQRLRNIDDVEKASIVAGEYDIVVRVHVETLEDLLKVTNKIQLVEGVKKTTTHVIEKEINIS